MTAKSRHPNAMVFLMLALVSGCSLYFENKRPDYTDVTKVQKGTPRYDVTAALGKPIESYKNEGKDIDVFQADPNGRYAGTKTAVTTFNTVADIFTIGMWEAVATPAEMLTKHKLTTYVVTYAPDQTVESIEAVAAPPKPGEQTAAVISPSPSSGQATPTESASAAATPNAGASPIAGATP
jgi:outer membrane protein assembly factor BamE (lipoprotein component of BamABCDE complex)